MAVDAVVSVVLQKVTDMLRGQSLTQNKLLVYEVQEIMKSLDSMRNLIMISTKEISLQDWCLEDVYMVEDQIEKFALSVVRRRKIFGFLANHIFLIDNLKSCIKIHYKIKETLMKLKRPEHPESTLTIQVLNEGKQEDKSFETRVTDHVSFSYTCDEEVMQIVGIKEQFQQTKQMSSFCYKEEEMGIFGLKEDVDTLVNRLTNDYEHVVLIVGQGGVGKTTLARAIYKNRDVKQNFLFRFWVSMLGDYTTKDILLKVLKGMDSMTDKASNKDDVEALKLKVSEYLKDKRYLIILDGANSFSILEDIKEAFPDVKNGSKLVLTSSQKIEMETTEGGLFSHCMMPLGEDDSWKMFKEKVGREKNWDLVSDESKQAVLMSCKGLPLNIILLSGLFSMTEISRWSRIFSCMQNSMDVVSLCYNDLSDNLKVCLLYLVLFPKEYDIPVRRLLRLWLAEGFVTHNSTEVLLQDIAQTYFEELVNRNMIQISKLRSDNSPRRCFLLGVLHDYLSLKAKETNLFHTCRNLINGEGVPSQNVRRMVEYESPKRDQVSKKQFRTEMSFHKNSLSKSSSFKNLRSYTSFYHRQPDYMQASRIRNFLENIVNDGFGLLRVLDLEGVYKPFLPENIGNLCNLRYLGLRSTYLDGLPPSVGELTHLETLDLKHTCIDELPCSIWKLKKLQHLHLNEMRLNMQPHSSMRLLTLWGLFLDKKVPLKDGLDKLNYLRELGITFFLTSNQEDLLNWITELSDLRSLRLQSKDNLGHPSKLVFRSMSKLGQLSHLNLLGSLEKLPEYNEFPPTLKVLTLSISLIKDDPMQTLGQLPCLTVLRLLGQSYIGKKMVCTKGGFSRLKVLKMWMLKELESWVVKEGSMQSLKHLEIRCCEKLQRIPTTLLQQPQLENLVLTGMPDTFTTDVVERNKSNHISMTIKHWKFPPLPASY
ncbi:putative inactive disease susceptibility protein LOV1 [Bidens hawaiensis]|uniref:putative inactive disease susceptibility protein LOV1 n=1 Tax=Bidens hawaiensis TaxID=980011 RepID=UPI0040498778